MPEAKARLLRCTSFGKAIVIARREEASWNKDIVITVEGQNADDYANGIVCMINESQCIECGEFNGLHGKIHVITGMEHNEVQGYYKDCPRGKK